MFLHVSKLLHKARALLTRLFVKEPPIEIDPIVTLADEVTQLIISNPDKWQRFSYTKLTFPYTHIGDATFNLISMQEALQTGAAIDRPYLAKQYVINYFTKEDGELCTLDDLLRYMEAIESTVVLIPKESPPHEEVGFNNVRKELKYQLNCLKLIFH